MNLNLRKLVWEEMTHEQKLAHLFPFGILGVGDQAWAIVGTLAIKVTIEEIQDWRIKGGPYAAVEYWVDEPVGHALTLDANAYGGLCPTKEMAIEVLLASYKDEVRACAEDLTDAETILSIEEANERLTWRANETLDTYRKDSIAFIRSTLVSANSSPEELTEHDEYCRTHYRGKVRFDDWFNISDILTGHVK